MSVSSAKIELQSGSELSDRAQAVGARYAGYLEAPYLKQPIAAFLCHAARIPGLYGAALTIQDDETTGPNLAAYGIADFAGSAMPEEAEEELVDAFSDVVGQLDAAVLNGPRPIGTSFEFINCHGIDLEEITRGLETGTLPSQCGIDFPSASHVAILARE